MCTLPVQLADLINGSSRINQRSFRGETNSVGGGEHEEDRLSVVSEMRIVGRETMLAELGRKKKNKNKRELKERLKQGRLVTRKKKS